MARKRMEETLPRLESWDEVNAALKEICELQIAQEKIEQKMQEKINRLKESAAEESKPMQEKVKDLETDIEVFCRQHRKDLKKAKSKKLNFGTIGWRKSSKISVPKKGIDEVVKKLKMQGMKDCIVTKETVNKDVLAKYSDAKITAIGAKRTTKDTFWYETNREKLEAV